MDWYSVSAVNIVPDLNADLRVQKNDLLIGFRAEILCKKENLRKDNSKYNGKNGKGSGRLIL
jgi:hypothetical protein